MAECVDADINVITNEIRVDSCFKQEITKSLLL